LCSWAFAVNAGKFLLKVLNANCVTHRSLPTDVDAVPPLEVWLGAA